MGKHLHQNNAGAKWVNHWYLVWVCGALCPERLGPCGSVNYLGPIRIELQVCLNVRQTFFDPTLMKYH
jgi:hypothetical protein